MGLVGFEKRWLLEIFAVILPAKAHPTLSTGAADLPLGAFIDDFFRTAPLETRLGVRAALWVVVLSPLLFGRAKTLLSLPPEEAAEVLRRLSGSRIYVLRELPMLIKMVACFGYAAFPEVRAEAGLPYRETQPPEWINVDPGNR